MSRMKALYPTSTTPVGASLLAMVVNDNAGYLTPRGVLGFIASKLAPSVRHPSDSEDNGRHRPASADGQTRTADYPSRAT
ncbi:hypothetical protein PspS34_27475 [Pseudomonas sp. S34]|nr:hypothetical protein PspS34_27475 [Pseudomonas sp. S34]